MGNTEWASRYLFARLYVWTYAYTHSILVLEANLMHAYSSTARSALSQFQSLKNQEIGHLFVVLERGVTDFKAPKL